MMPGEGGLALRVAKAGALVSPALISPPSPLDRLRIRGFSVWGDLPSGVNMSAVESNGNASVAVILAVCYVLCTVYHVRCCEQNGELQNEE